MRKLLNTLYVTTPDAYLSKDGESVSISVQQKEVFRIPILNIESIVTFGYMGASPGLMKLCQEQNVSLCFLTPNGRFISRIQGPTRGNVLLRKRQYALSDNPEACSALSRIIIAGKIHNSRAVLQRALRDNGPNEYLDAIVTSLHNCQRHSLFAKEPDRLRGIEGDAAKEYFSAFPHLILQQKAAFPFKGRNRRPPKDAVNVMLSFCYTLLTNDVAAALETVGLDPYVGFFHTLRPGRASLALDMVEELRAYMVDRLVLSLINRKQIGPQHFSYQEEETVLLTDTGRKILIGAWQERKKQELTHPYIGEKIPLGLLPYSQAMLLARFVRGDLDNYPVFLVK